MRGWIVMLAACAPRPVPAPAARPAAAAPVPAERGETLYRVHLATGVVTTIDSARAAPLDGDVEAKIEGERLHIKRGPRVIIDGDAHGAYSVNWQIRRDDMLYLSLFRNDSQTYEAVRLDTGAVVWSRVVVNDEPGASHGAFPTTSGPLVVHHWYSIAAIRPADGTTLWTVPWSARSAPVKLLEAGASSIVCGQDVLALDAASGRERWRRASAGGAIADCTLVGRQVLVETRVCGAKDCTPQDNFALDADTGRVLYTRPKPFGRVVVVTDRDHALLEVDAPAPKLPGGGGPDTVSVGVALFDAHTGSEGAPLALDGFLSAERLPEGDVLVRGTQTTRLAVDPLAIRWQMPAASSAHAGNFLVGTESDLATGKSTLVLIDIASGVERTIALPTIPSPLEFPWELGGARVVGTSPTDVDVAIQFGFLG